MPKQLVRVAASLCACVLFGCGAAVPSGAGDGGTSRDGAVSDATRDIDECAVDAPCGRVPGTLCADTVGSYACTCPMGYSAPPTGGTCGDIDECGLGTCGPGVATCTNAIGSYTCTCGFGYVVSGAGAPCVEHITYVKASNTGRIDYFGNSVSFSADGMRVAVGAFGESSRATGIDGTQADDSADDSGAVYVFSRVGATWTPEAYIKASNTGATDQFGWVVSLSSDGTRLAVGANLESSNATGVDGDQTDDTAGYSGAVYVFSRSGTTWTQEAYIKASNSGATDLFGDALAFSADGTRLAVSAPQEDSSATGIDGDQTDDTGAESGAVYVFSRSGTTWAQEAYIKASSPGSRFGQSISISSNGTRIAIGAPYDSMDTVPPLLGAAYLFSRSGTTWAQEAYIRGSNTTESDLFGYSVALSSDGTRLAIGAFGEDSSATGVGGDEADNSAPASGAVYVFSLAGGTWTQEGYIKASNTGAGDFFGLATQLSSDGAWLAVLAPFEASAATGVGGNQEENTAPDSGAAYLFSSTDSVWTQRAYLKASNTQTNDLLSSISLSSDGRHLAMGAIGESSGAMGIDGEQADNRVFQSGAVYIF